MVVVNSMTMIVFYCQLLFLLVFKIIWGLFSYFRYQELMKESSRMPLFDLRKLNASLPVPSVPNCSLEVLVLGANDDFIVVSVFFPHQWYYCPDIFIRHFSPFVGYRMQRDLKKQQSFMVCHQYVLKQLPMTWCWILPGRKVQKLFFHG